MPIEFRILGPLEVLAEGKVVPLGSPKQRALLGLLLVHANETVPRDRLIEELWGDAPPASVGSEVHVYLSRLRRLLESAGAGEALLREAYGYRLAVGPEALDAIRFEALAREGRQALAAGDAVRAGDRLREALALWRGPALADLPSEQFAVVAGARLEEERVSALEHRFEADLALGHERDVVHELEKLVAEHPYREHLCALLMLALYRNGRQAEALAVYQQARSRLLEELGLEPGSELQQVQQGILRHDPELDPVVSPPARERLPHEERKVVSVLFCDLVGSTAQAERLDPEDMRALLSRFHGQVRSELERFGGTVEKFIGDAVVAFFGAPVAHEDDPERAVRAALAIRDWVVNEPELHVRIAVETGEALVMLDADPASGEGMVSGIVVNAAARLQTAAPVDGILVGEQTYRATERAIEYRSAAPVHAKGMLEPLTAWEVVQARSRLGAEPARRWAAPLIGRERELELLHAALERACEQRQAQMVTLVGTPGIGKSRLIADFYATVVREGRDLCWRQGRSLSYGNGVSFWALGEIVKAQANILESDDADDASSKLDDLVERLALDEGEAQWIGSHLLRLLGLAPDGRDGTREESFAAWRRFVEVLAEERPLVLVFEDLHWADDGLLDFVDELADSTADVPLLLLGTARPELLARRPAWGGGKPNATTLSLPPLSDEQSSQLLHALTRRSTLRADMESALLERAGGNPLFTEELVRTALEAGGELQLPESVHAVIAARLDALPSQDKSVLQEAAVIGNVFWTGPLLSAETDTDLVEERLHNLERREFVRRERRSAMAGESQFAFRHALVRDVVYATIPRAERAERHRRAAWWIESLGRPDDHADLLAYHYGSALELTKATGGDTAPLEAPTARALERAGDRARALNDFPAAIRFYDQALDLVHEQSRPSLLFRLGAALTRALDRRRLDVLEQARDALLAAGDVERAAEAAALLAEVWAGIGEADRSRQELEQARQLVEGRGATPAAARVLAQAARYASLRGDADVDEALELGREALRLGEQLGLDEVVVSALDSIGQVRIGLGDREGGRADLERAIELGLATNNPDTPRSYNNLAWALDTGEDLDRLRQLQLAGKRAAERLGNRAATRLFSAMLVHLAYRSGSWDEALDAADALLAESAAAPVAPGFKAWVQAPCAHILLRRDDEAAAEAVLGDLLRVAQTAGDPMTLTVSLVAAAAILLELGREDEARAVVDRILPLLRAGRLPLEAALPIALVLEPLGLCDALRDALTNSPNGAAQKIALAIVDGDLVRAADLLAGGGERTFEASVRLRAAALLAEAGRTADAAEQREKALEFYRGVGATRYIRELTTSPAAVQTA